MEKFNKKDTVEFIKKLEKDHRADYEGAGFKWPVVNVRMTLEKIREEYAPLKKFLELPDSDVEDSETTTTMRKTMMMMPTMMMTTTTMTRMLKRMLTMTPTMKRTPKRTKNLKNKLS